MQIIYIPSIPFKLYIFVYMYMLHHFIEDVADSSGTLVFRKDALGVGLYTIKIIDNSAEHEESASFAVTYGIAHQHES